MLLPLNKTANVGIKNVEIMVSLKYLRSFLEFLECLQLIVKVI